MALRTRILLMLGVVMAVLFLALYIAAREITLSSFANLERAEVVEDMTRVARAVDGEIDGLDAANSDWSQWDDTYQFIQDRNPAYIKANVVDGTFNSLGLNVMLFVDRRGRIVYGKGYDLARGKRVPVPESLLRYLRESPQITTRRPSPGIVSGVVRLPEGPMLVSSSPILTSSSRGPVRGSVIMGRFVDEPMMRQLSSVTRQRLTLLSPNATGLPSALSTAHPIADQVAGENKSNGYYLARGLDGAGAFVVEAAMERPIYQRGLATLRQFMWSLLAVGIVLSVVTGSILEGTILGRLQNLAADVRRIGRSEDFSGRVGLSGSDELTGLATDVNATVETLDRHIADLRRTKEALRQSEDRYRTLVEAAPDAILVVQDGMIVFANPATARLLAAGSAEDIVGKSLSELAGSDPDEAEIRLNSGQETADGSVTTVEGGLTRLDGVRIDVEIARTPTTYEDEPATQVIFRDITERRQIEKVKAAIVDMVSHELRTPLAVISGNAETVTRLYQREDQREACMRALSTIQRRASDMAGLIENLLDVSRIQTGRFPLEMTDVDLAALVVREAESVQLGETHELVLEIPTEMPLVRCDARRIATAVANVVGNAVKFSPAGGEIRVAVTHAKDGASVSVEDCGVGIPPEDQARIFERFEQSDMSRARSFEGTGIGLYLVREIIKAHGGTVSVDSAPGRGTKLTLGLPLAGPVAT